MSAAKFSRAERELKAARPREDAKPTEEKPNYLYIAVSSDRGLCGAIHSSVARKIRHRLIEYGDHLKVICIGDKNRAIIARTNPKNILFACSEVRRIKFS